MDKRALAGEQRVRAFDPPQECLRCGYELPENRRAARVMFQLLSHAKRFELWVCSDCLREGDEVIASRPPASSIPKGSGAKWIQVDGYSPNGAAFS